jgi:cytoskeletal protein RodZ
LPQINVQVHLWWLAVNRAGGNPHRTDDHPELGPLSGQTGIGEKLRLAREARGIALRDISEQTRISMRYLTAIETDDYKRLPGGIFNRSFIRAYARHINYDEDQAIAEYAEMMREQSDSPDEVPTKPHKSLVYTEGTTPNRSPAWTLVWAILILAALSLTIWAGLHFYQRRFSPRAPTGANQRTPPDKRLRSKDVTITMTTINRNAGEEHNEFAE